MPATLDRRTTAARAGRGVDLRGRHAIVTGANDALHPGIVKTELARDQPWRMLPVGLLMWPFMKGVERGAATTVYAATAPELARAGETIYFSDCAPARTPKLAGQAGVEARPWQRSAELVGL